ncbi:MAG: peptidoglycan-binding protein [Treponema sp.]|nr:peptidoglycan-binding protein [Treponema sp.]
MKKYFVMDCRTVMDAVYAAEKDSSLPVLTQIQIRLHLLFCPVCAREQRNLQIVEEIMKTDFFPPSPEFENVLMKRLYEEDIEENMDAPTGFSFRGWVIIGFFVLLSLSSSFFGINFVKIANSEGLSFVLPLGLTIGAIVTCYGALFIGSHLKELSNRFRLR